MEALHGQLWSTGQLADMELYLRLRKVEPLDRAMEALGVRCWASGVRGSQTDHRKAMEPLALVRQRWSLRPLLDWTPRDVFYYMQDHNLPQHPLFEQGYSTVGDWHSSGPDDGTSSGRATRFGGLKQECGIHLPGVGGEGIEVAQPPGGAWAGPGPGAVVLLGNSRWHWAELGGLDGALGASDDCAVDRAETGAVAEAETAAGPRTTRLTNLDSAVDPESVIATEPEPEPGAGSAGQRLVGEAMASVGIRADGMGADGIGAGLRCFHTSPAPEPLPIPLARWRAWAAVGELPRGLELPARRRLSLDQVPLGAMPPWLGIDRALVGWGAWSRQNRRNPGRAVLVADAGTALSLTRVDGQGRFCGGRLAAGVALQMRALAGGTALLPPWIRPGGRTPCLGPGLWRPAPRWCGAAWTPWLRRSARLGERPGTPVAPVAIASSGSLGVMATSWRPCWRPKGCRSRQLQAWPWKAWRPSPWGASRVSWIDPGLAWG
jgi:hypothetical protein